MLGLLPNVIFENLRMPTILGFFSFHLFFFLEKNIPYPPLARFLEFVNK